MVRMDEEWMERMIVQACRDVPVPVPANLKESILRQAALQQEKGKKRRRFYYSARLYAAACMSMVILYATAYGISAWEKAGLAEIKMEWVQDIGSQVDGFAKKISHEMDAMVSGRQDRPEYKGGKGL